MKKSVAFIAAAAFAFSFMALSLTSCDSFNGGQNFAADGAISIQLPANAPISRSVSSGGALGGSISKFKVVVRNLAAKINTEQYANPGSMVTIDNLLPGSWDVAIFGYQNAAQGSDLELCYYGNARNTQVIAGLTSYANVALYKVEGNTRLDFTLASDPSGAAASRTSVSKAYVVYSCDELGQSGTAFYDYAEPQGGSNPQPADTSKIIIPVPDFLEPGYSCSAKVYLFTSDNVGGGYKTLWNGTVAGKAQAGGTLSGDLAYTETCLVNSNMGTNKTYIRMDKAFSNELHNNMGYEFAPQTSGSTGTAIDYADLEIFPAVADSCGDNVPLIVKYQDMIWTDTFEFKHLSAVPSIVVPGMVTESTGVKKLYIPDFVSRTLSTPTFSPSAPTQFKVCEAASSDDYGFAKYSVSGTETDSWSAPFQYVSTDPSGTAMNVEFTAPSTFYPKSQGATDGFTCNTVIARGTHGYFADAEAATTKSVSVPFTVQGASWTATGPGDVMLYSPFTITLECAAALASELDAVLPSLTVNVGTSEITGVTKARSGSKVVISVPGQDTWNAGEQKTLSIEYNSHQLGNDVMVNIAQPTSGGGGSGGGNGGGTSGSVVNLYVKQNGNDGNDGLSEDTAFKTIGAADKKITQLNDANANYVINIVDKLWQDNLSVDAEGNTQPLVISTAYAKSITIKGTGSNEIDGQYDYEGQGTVIKFTTNVPVLIESITIKGGCASNTINGGCIFVSSTSNVTLGQGSNVVGGSIGDGKGGGVYVENGATFVIDANAQVDSASTSEVYLEPGAMVTVGKDFETPNTIPIASIRVRDDDYEESTALKVVDNPHSKTIYNNGVSYFGLIVPTDKTGHLYGYKIDNQGKIFYYNYN